LQDHAAGLLLSGDALEAAVLKDLDLDEAREENEERPDPEERDDPEPPRVARVQGITLARTGTASASLGGCDGRKGWTLRNKAPRRAASPSCGMARAVGWARSMSMICAGAGAMNPSAWSRRGSTPSSRAARSRTSEESWIRFESARTSRRRRSRSIES